MPGDQVAVSVIIPNYNYQKTLEKCLDSVFAQTYRPIEVIVSDDASTDRSREIAERFPCILVTAPYNRGVSAARNAGVRASHGQILFFLDSDEALMPNAVANAVDILDSTTCDVVHGLIAKEPLVDDGFVERCRILHAHHARKQAVGPTATAYFAVTAMRRKVFEDVGFFDERLRDAEDVEYSERLAGNFSIVLSDRLEALHDEVDQLVPMLREQYRRARKLVPLTVTHRGRTGSIRINSTAGIASASLTLLAATLGLVWPPFWWVAATSLVWFVVANPGLSCFVGKERGAVFLVGFTAVNFLSNVAIALGSVSGGLSMLLCRSWKLLRNSLAPVRTQ